MLLVIVPLCKLVFILISKVSCPCFARPKYELVGEVSGGGLGADTPVVGMPARKNASLLGAAMVGVVTVVVGVVNAETPVAELPERALLLWVVGVHLVALEAVGERGGLTALAFAQYKVLVALHVIVIVFILRPFTSNETGEVTNGRGGGTALVKVRDKAGIDCGVGEASLGVEKLAFKLLFAVLDGYLLPLATLCLVDVRAVPMDVSDDTRVLEVSKGVINEGAGSVRGMKNVVVRIFRTRTIEIGGGERTCVEGE
jgi:hypothetical protein